MSLELVQDAVKRKKVKDSFDGTRTRQFFLLTSQVEVLRHYIESLPNNGCLAACSVE